MIGLTESVTAAPFDFKDHHTTGIMLETIHPRSKFPDSAMPKHSCGAGRCYHVPMKVQRVYVDTSVLGGCFDVEFATWSSGLITDFRKGTFRAVLSQVVVAEVEDAPLPVRRVYEELVTLGSEVVSFSSEARQLADAYQQRGIVSPKYYIDGLTSHLQLLRKSTYS